jgi:ABC-type branched-subunit amino acid transport system substrate-binding protein
MRSSASRAVLLLAAAASLARASAEGGEAVPREVRVGLLLPRDEALARSVSRGAAVAAAAAAPVRILERRARGPWGSEAAEAVGLVYEDGAAAIVAAPDRGTSHLAAQVAAKARVPVLTLSAEGALTRIPLPWVLRAVHDEREVLGALLAALPPGGTRGGWSVFVDAGREGDRVAGEVRGAAARAGLSAPLVSVLGSGPGGAARVPPSGPALFAASTRASASALRALRAEGWGGEALLLTDAAGSGPILAETGDAAEGAVVPRAFDPSPGSAAAVFARAFRDLHGAEPDEAAAAAHDAVLALAAAVRASDGSPDGVRRALLEGPPREGASGSLAFDASGDRRGAPPLARFRGGVLVPFVPTPEKRP